MSLKYKKQLNIGDKVAPIIGGKLKTRIIKDFVTEVSNDKVTLNSGRNLVPHEGGWAELSHGPFGNPIYTSVVSLGKAVA